VAWLVARNFATFFGLDTRKLPTPKNFRAETKKISELYSDLFKQTTKPFENLMEKNKAA